MFGSEAVSQSPALANLKPGAFERRSGSPPAQLYRNEFTSARQRIPAAIRFAPHAIPRYFLLEGFRSNGVQACWINQTRKKNLLSRILFCIPVPFSPSPQSLLSESWPPAAWQTATSTNT